ncbi:hypothetical protein ElyMa_006983000 [Elysia marginata]|uniref:Mos1 transposase HTH domain-containing protein n=1 Tax=Elysia marginata TaxID=1093978 RepID=A0AAV4JMV3_9GAST|nr:hypothetical protein ElyMa_006983000 [Elysia marginata]
MAAQAEEAANKGDQRTLYKITKQVCGKSRNNIEALIRNKEGQLLASEARWTRHFNEVLNRPASDAEPDIQEADHNTSNKRRDNKSH